MLAYKFSLLLGTDNTSVGVNRHFSCLLGIYRGYGLLTNARLPQLSNLKVIYRLLIFVLTNGISDFNIFAVDNKLHIHLHWTIIQTSG